MNRSIETRSEKKPLLSDLKESGCINYLDNVSLSCVLENSINLMSLESKYMKLKTNNLTNKQIQYKTLELKLIKKNIRQQILISQQYIFKCKCTALKKLISLTYNHKYLSQENWTKTYKILDYTKINFLEEINNTKTKQYNIINITYINHIKFKEYSKSYDISIETYFNFVSKQIILHNSIEQDADIVMILYEKTKKNTEMADKKVLDIVICKNRNGPTGVCEIIFIPKTTIFQSTHNKKI